MRIIRKCTPDLFPRSVLTIGNFDGVHLGHQSLLQTLSAAQKRYQAPALLMTFEPQPLEFFQKQNAPTRITLFRDKLSLLAPYELSAVLAMPFNAHLAAMSASHFIEHILHESLHVKALVVGDDFHFGKAREGNAAFLKQHAKRFDFEVIELNSVMTAKERVSSTHIRALLAQGDIDTAVSHLGHPVTMSGKVIHGDKRGRLLGFPTANIALSKRKPPMQGIFVVSVTGIRHMPILGVASLGFRPMFGVKQPLLEVHLFDFNEEIYGKRIVVQFHKKLRDELAFDSIDGLIAQMDIDKHQARSYFESLI